MANKMPALGQGSFLALPIRLNIIVEYLLIFYNHTFIFNSDQYFQSNLFLILLSTKTGVIVFRYYH